MDSNVMFPMCSPKTSNSFQPAVPSVNNIVNYSSPDFNKNKSVSNKKSHITPPQAVKLSKQDRIFYNRCFSKLKQFILNFYPVMFLFTWMVMNLCIKSKTSYIKLKLMQLWSSLYVLQSLTMNSLD